MDRRLLTAAAASPLLWAAGLAQAETTISDARTTPVATATAASGTPDNLTVASGGSVKPTSGAAITLNSDNNVSIAGAAGVTDANDSTALLIQGGRRGEVTLSGALTVDESYTPTDADNDGDLDGPFAQGSNRAGVRVTGTEAFRGSIVQTAGAIVVEGNDSAGIRAQAGVDGSIRAGGSISVVGDRSIGIHTAGAVGGDVRTTGGVTAQGAGAIGVAVDGPVGGKLVLGGPVTVSGYRYTTPPSDVSKLDADDLLQGGPAVRVRGTVLGGVLVDAPPPNNDPNDDDEDDDGVPDASETTGVIASYGAAAAIEIGGPANISLGLVGAGNDAYGLVIKGTAQGLGLYDGVSAQGVVIGGQGGLVDVVGGVKVQGTVSSTALGAGAVGLHLKDGARAPVVANSGTIRAGATAVSSAVEVRALQIDQGAVTSQVTNTGTIAAAITGSQGVATAIRDLSGSLSLIENSGLIAATLTPLEGTVTGRAIALDLRANTNGVTVRQTANASDTVTATLRGDVLFGSGPSRLELLSGVLIGDVAFGTGADSLLIGGGATLNGALTNAGGGLAVQVLDGRLTATNTGAVNLSSLDVGQKGQIVLTATPSTGAHTQLVVAGDAVLADGAQIGLRFTDKLTDPTSFTLVRAGRLVVQGELGEELLAQGPWLYRTTLRADTAQNALVADVRRRTAEEAGLSAGQAGAYEAVFQAFDRDATVRDALLGKSDAAGFIALYDQFLPDYSGALFRVFASAQEATARAMDGAESQLPPGGRRVWAQEIGVLQKQTLDGAAGFEADGFGFAAGVESAQGPWGALGLQTSFLNITVDENGSAAAEKLTGSALSGGAYWRLGEGPLTITAGANAGYAWLQADRAVVDTGAGLSRTASSEWNALMASAHTGIAYTARMGRVHLRPMISADFVYLDEDGRTESGGGEAVDLEIDGRTSQQLSAFAGVALGATFGDPQAMLWRPEVTVGYRTRTGDGPDATTARFISGGPSFTLAAPELDDGAMVVRVGLRGSTRYFDLGFEAGGEIRDDYEAYDGRVVARLAF